MNGLCKEQTAKNCCSNIFELFFELLCRCTNSNYPKAHGDKSPGGIGLQLTQQRLDLTYARRYTWKKGPSDDGTVYTSELRIML